MTGPTFPRVLNSEWVKMRTLRSTAFTLLAAVVGLVGFGLLVCAVINANFSHLRPQRIAVFDPIGTSLGGVHLAQLAIGVLGVLLISGEYSTGMIRSTLAAVPTRLPVLAAKSLLYGVVTLVLMVPSAFVAFLGGQALLHSHGTTLSATHALRSVFGVALYLTAIAVLAVALGFLIRNTAGGIATLFGLLLVVPGLGNLLPTSWQQNVLPYLPSNAGAALYDPHPEDPWSLSPWAGYAVLWVWVAVVLVLAAVALRRRDT